jgi:hypothetical protein
MNNKPLLLIAVLLTLSIFSAVYFSHLAIAETADEVIQSQIGINPGNIPSSPEEAQNIATKYLKREWSKIIAGVPVIGPIHTYLLANPIVFQVLFNYKYEISLTLIGIIILWIYFASVSGNALRASGLIKKRWQTALVGLALAIILAHINVLKIIISFFLEIAFSDKAWYIRLIIWVLTVLFAWLFALISHKLATWKAKIEKAQKEAEVAQAAKEGQTFAKGAEKGKELKEKLNSGDSYMNRKSANLGSSPYSEE